MKTFFRTEYSALDAVGALSVKDSINQTQLQTSLNTLQKDLTAHLEDSLHTNLIQALQTFSSLEREHQDEQIQEPTSPINNSTNATVMPKTDPTLLTLIQSLIKELNNLKTRSISTYTTPTSDTYPSINPRTQQPYKRYCWTHGCGNHWSDKCRNPKPGHKAEATFRNRMGGSNKGCLPQKD